MGLDDQDEVLLWRYLATVPAQQRAAECSPIIELLRKRGVLTGHVVHGYHYEAVMDSRFVKPGQGFLARFKPKELKDTAKVDLNNLVLVNLEEFAVSLEEQVRSACFEKWWPDITSILRDDQVNWNPATASDISLKLVIDSELIAPEITRDAEVLHNGME
jgi:hypothetical protein